MKWLEKQHPMVVVLLWGATLGVFSVVIDYRRDPKLGFVLRLHGWPERIGRWWHERKQR